MIIYAVKGDLPQRDVLEPVSYLSNILARVVPAGTVYAAFPYSCMVLAGWVYILINETNPDIAYDYFYVC